MSEHDPSWPSDDTGDQPTTPPPPPPDPSPAAPPPASSPAEPPPSPGAAAAGATSAGLGIRFGARLIDGIITAIIGFVLGFVIPGDSIVVSSIIGAIVALGYFVALETSSGATPGKKILNLQVVGANGGNPTVEESLKRNIWLGFQVVPIVGGFLGLAAAIAIAVTIATNDDNRGIHDNFAGTSVPKV